MENTQLTNDLKRAITTVLEDLRECESALNYGESNRAHERIIDTIVRLEYSLHDAYRNHPRT
jgi:hypothetical protein